MISETILAACDNAIRSSRRGDTCSGIGLAREHANQRPATEVLIAMAEAASFIRETNSVVNAEALWAFDEALTRATRIRHPLLVDTHFVFSKLYTSALQFEMALEAMEQTYELADANRPTVKMATASECIAGMHERLGRQREAAHYHAKALLEREAFERDNEYAVRDLNSFWCDEAAEHA